ncbi:ankyrin repeat and SOCS box protein 2-like isoform X1 [Seriola lalandi dorsalis]|uniref:ankyrin repeat and SOCS box protein 2-like isoform X1 n=1 Tax=Seriola lalandi dorsalis TaxID=1841481 RepID=UPI000C6F8AA0|nr:ankyrin repeat and SOCS box protein 2-like isoform X1 [Seriola lalandi dorsalis]XP_023251076.1 ankyrin repeat and SOCS box protein 2-like isoform X1 [Seriola lalandi dorsalis]
MAAASISRSGSAALGFEDYSLYSNLSEDELLQLAIERSLTDANCSNANATCNATDNPTSNTATALTPPHQPDRSLNPAARDANQPRYSSHNPPANYTSHNPPVAQTTAHYSSPNPPSEKPPDPKTFDGTVSRFMTGSGKRMVAYRRVDGTLVHIAPEPEEEEEPLFRAISVGDASRVKALVMSPGTNLMLPSKPGWLAIHQAAWYGQDTCLRVLLSGRNTPRQRHHSPEQRRHLSVSLCSAQPGMINKRTERGESALLVGVSKDQLRCVQVLLEYGADPDITNYERETPLYKACERNSAAMVAVLLNHGAAVNTHCIQGWTALQEAVVRNNVEICEMLLKAGAKHSLTNMYGISPLFSAAQTGQATTLRFLLKHGADINSQAADGATALYEAAKNGHEEIVKLLLSQNADANKPGKTGLLPLHIAAQRGSDIIVSLLISATSKARIRRTGISPLHMAAERNRDEVLEALIEAGFDVNAQLSEERSKLYEDRRSTALYFSVINNNIDAVRMLLTAGADPNLDAFKPLMVAARLGCIQTVTLLVEHGADINASIPTHPTTFPAIYMFSMKYLTMFKYLLDHGGHALSCFGCVYGNKPHPPIKTTRSERDDLTETLPRRGVQFCEMISAPSICRWAGPIIDILLDYVGHVTLCSRLMEHLDSYSDWSVIKEKAAPPRPLMQLCRLQILQLVGSRRVKKLTLPGGLIRFLQHQGGSLDDC